MDGDVFALLARIGDVRADLDRARRDLLDGRPGALDRLANRRAELSQLVDAARQAAPDLEAVDLLARPRFDEHGR